jgi:hypothetical protein
MTTRTNDKAGCVEADAMPRGCMARAGRGAQVCAIRGQPTSPTSRRSSFAS